MSKLPGGFTVLMSAYKNNDALLLEKAIDSIFLNSILPDHFILIIDGPISQSLKKEILKLKFKYKFKIFYLPINVGLPSALNFGLSKVKTKWVFRADADDINHKNRFYIQTKFLMKYPNIDLLGSSINEIDELGNFVSKKIPPLNFLNIKKYIKYRNPFNHMTVAFKVDLIRNLGGYPNFFLKEDYGLWIRLIGLGYNCVNLPNALVSATTGSPFYKRRGGFKYVLSEFHIQKLLLSYRLTNIFLSFFILTSRSLIFLSPKFARALIYKNFLRS